MIGHIKSNTIADFTGTVTVFNSAGLTQTANATDMVLPSDWNSVHNQLYTLTGNTSNASTASGTNVVFSGGRNISLVGSGSVIGFQGPDLTPYLTTAAASDHSHGNPTLALTNLSGTTASNSAGFTLSLSAAAAGGGGLTNINVSAGTTSNNLSALTFGNLNGITFGLNASTITASHNGLTTAAQSNHSHGNPTLALTNLNGTTASNSAGLTLSLSAAAQTVQPVAASGSNGSFAFSTLSFGNLNGMSFYTSNGSIVASYTDGGGGGGNINVSAGTTSNNMSALTFDNAGGVSFGLNGSVITASAPAGGGGGFSAGMSNLGNTSGTSGTVGSNIVFVGSSGIGLSQSVNSNSATLTIFETPAYLSWFSNRQMNPNTVADGYAQGSQQIAPFNLPYDLSAAFIRQINSISMGSTSFATTANTTFSFGQSETRRFNLYSRGTGADSTILSRISSTTAGLTHTLQVGAGTAGTQYTITQGVTYPISNGTSTYSTTYGVSNASMQISSTHMSAFTGVKMVPQQWDISLSRGDYWMGVQWSSTTSTQGTAGLTGARMLMSQWALSNPNVAIAPSFGAPTANSAQLAQGLGLYSSGDVATVAFSTISSQASQRINYWELGRIA